MKALAIASAALMLAGCATMTRGRTEKFEIQTVPEGATATLSTGQTCVTPCSLTLPRKKKFKVTLEKDGYKKATAKVTNKVSNAGTAGFLGNALIGGVIGAGLDAADGATLDLVPNPLKVTMKPETPAGEKPPAGEQPKEAPPKTLAQPKQPEAPPSSAPAPAQSPGGTKPPPMS